MSREPQDTSLKEAPLAILGFNSLALPKVKAPLSSVTAEAWQSSLVLPLDYLEETLGFGEGSKANVCFILGPADARRHFSWAPLPVGPPDFHRVADFVPVSIVAD